MTGPAPNETDRRAQMAAQTKRIQDALSRVKHKILVMSGKGGVGKSTVAVNLAVGLANRGNKVGLIDVDLHGPSVPGLLGIVGVRPNVDDKQINPIPYLDNLSVLSMGNLMLKADDAVIWRGPLKIGAIRQFVADTNWGDLDFLVVDSPPGTGDEPLTVAQDFVGVKAVVVTSPQEVSLADVRKSINFCSSVGMPVLGLVENFSSYVCPNCGHEENLFGSGGGERTARQMGVPFLGGIPIDPKIVQSGDAGEPFMRGESDSPAVRAYNDILDRIENFYASTGDAPKASTENVQAADPKQEATAEAGVKRIAIPTAQGALCAHFGHCELFALVTVKDGEIVGQTMLDPPPHEPGVLPKWLAERGANIIIAGGMGSRAQGLFNESGIDVVVGAQPGATPEDVVKGYLAGTLQTGDNICDH